MRIARRPALALTGAALVCAAQAADPIDSGDCRRALEVLQAASAPADRARYKALQQAAAQACLGGPAEVEVPARRYQPPIVVRPLGVPPPLVGPPSALTLPPPGPLPPRSVGACDALGCWASDGTRLQRVGPQLLGPTGLCSVQGSLLQCP